MAKLFLTSFWREIFKRETSLINRSVFGSSSEVLQKFWLLDPLLDLEIFEDLQESYG